MDVKIKAKTSFAHGRFNLDRGQEAEMPEAVAKDLEKAGLVEVGEAAKAPEGKKAAEPSNKAAPAAKNK
jgi:hypothetical protein